MSEPSPRRPEQPDPAAKSKTDLRRGQFTPGLPAARKTNAPRPGTGTTDAEQAMLFDEPSES